MESRPSLTALAVCWMRDVATRRGDGVLADPLAKRFLPLSWRAAARVGSRLPADPLSAYVPLRHRFIDDAIDEALTDGAAQVVLLGTGYDTRPWRLGAHHAGVRWFGVDHPATLGRRRRRLADMAGPDRVEVPVDFRTDDLHTRLAEAGHRPDEPTVWVWEGVSMYLSRDQVVACLEGLRAHSVAGSHLLLDLWHRVDGDGRVDGLRRALPAFLEVIAEPVRFGVHPADAPSWLAERGWNTLDLSGGSALQQRYDARYAPDPCMSVVHAVPSPP